MEGEDVDVGDVPVVYHEKSDVFDRRVGGEEGLEFEEGRGRGGSDIGSL